MLRCVTATSVRLSSQLDNRSKTDCSVAVSMALVGSSNTNMFGLWSRARAKVIDWRFDARYFPDLSKGKVLAAFMVDSFDMVFPPSIIEAIRQAG